MSTKTSRDSPFLSERYESHLEVNSFALVVAASAAVVLVVAAVVAVVVEVVEVALCNFGGCRRDIATALGAQQLKARRPQVAVDAIDLLHGTFVELQALHPVVL